MVAALGGFIGPTILWKGWAKATPLHSKHPIKRVAITETETEMEILARLLARRLGMAVEKLRRGQNGRTGLDHRTVRAFREASRMRWIQYWYRFGSASSHYFADIVGSTHRQRGINTDTANWLYFALYMPHIPADSRTRIRSILT
jgi:hypothetical protein